MKKLLPILIRRVRAVASFSLLAAATSLIAEDYLYHPRDAEEAGGAPRFVVPDPDAQGGTAQAAIPGKSRPGSYTAALYAYCRPGAKYKVTWRMKIDDNRIPDLVVKIWTHDEQGRDGYKGGSLELKGTDFKAPNQYQEFTYNAEKTEGGFFNVGAIWQGKGRLHIDFIKIVPEKFYTEREMLEHKGKIDLPEAWYLPRPVPPVIHLAKGLWWDFFGLSEAMAELGGATWTSSYHCSGQYGMTLRNFPATWQELMGYNLVVITNADAQAVGTNGRMLLEEYVKNGGSLLICGGPYSFGKGGYKGTALEKLLPCEMTGTERVKVEGENILKPAAGAEKILPDDLAWDVQPRALFHHPVRPKDGALVLAAIGDKPAVLAWNCGKGRVAAMAITAEGQAGDGQLAFWEWGDWPRLMASVMRWLTAEQGKEPPPANSAATRKALEDLMAPAADEDPGPRMNKMNNLLSRGHDKAFAKDILEIMSGFDGTPGRPLVEAIARTVRPYVDAEFAKPAMALVDSGNPGKVALGLQVLGMCRTPEGAATILKYLERGAAALKSSGGGGGAEGGLDELVTQARSGDNGDDQRIKLAAAIAIGNLGDPKNLPALKAVPPPPTGKAAAADGELGELTDLNENLLQQLLAARARLGDAAAVGPFLDEVMANILKIEHYVNYMDVMLLDPDDKELIRGRKVAVQRLPILRQRQVLCMDVLGQFPDSVYPAVGADLAKRGDERLAPFAYAALSGAAGKPVKPETAAAFLPAVEKCNVRELRRLALNMVLAGGDAALKQKLGETLAALAAGKETNAAMFAIRSASRLPAEARCPILSAALKNPDERVRRIAKASICLAPPDKRDALSRQAGGK